VGSGVAGIGAAWLLSANNDVDVFEAGGHLGGHAHSVDVDLEGQTFPVDTGFMVFNKRTYPNLIRFFNRLGIEWIESDMSFSVHIPAMDIQWAGRNLDSVFADRKNLANPRFLKMLADVVRFSRDADRLLADPAIDDLTLGELLAREGYGGGFTDWYLIPMGDAIWSTPPGEMLDYPAGTFLRFCDNHGLLHITGKPQWRSVVGGSRTYVDAASRAFSGEVFLGEPVRRVERSDGGVTVTTDARSERYDVVVIATHPPQTLEMLADASAEERALLGAFGFWPNEITLHTDETFLPPNPRAWAAWNWYAETGDITKDMLRLTYHINWLQKLPIETPVLETLNQAWDPAVDKILLKMTFDHPMFSHDAVRAQKRLDTIQGKGGVYYAGAWSRYGFHEDGLLSGVRTAELLGAKVPWGDELDATRTRVLAPDAGEDSR
jgi:predicted NAD/FAD-binding protein